MRLLKTSLYAALTILFINLIGCKHDLVDIFKLEGTIKGVKDSTIIELYYLVQKDGEWHKVIDSAKVVGGKFFFKGNITGVTEASISWTNSYSVRIYMEPTEMKLELDIDKPHLYKMTGTKVEEENLKLRKELAEWQLDEKFYEKVFYIINTIDRVKQLDESPLKDSLSASINQAFSDFELINKKADSIRLDFVLKHNTYQIAPNLLYFLIEGERISIDSAKSIYNNFPEQIQQSVMGKFVHKAIEQKEGTQIGHFAPDFTRESPSGETIKLSDFRNKNYVLLDFWASWCGPCIASMPEMKKIYNKYKTNGLEIIGISQDDSRDAWLQAIDKHELGIWTHILSYEQKGDPNVFWQDDLSDIYNTMGVPYYVLIDKDGKVIARWEHIGEEQLKEIDNILLK